MSGQGSASNGIVLSSRRASNAMQRKKRKEKRALVHVRVPFKRPSFWDALESELPETGRDDVYTVDYLFAEKYHAGEVVPKCVWVWLARNNFRG